MELDDAVNRIKSFVGTRYDGAVVDALVQACKDGAVRAIGVYPKSQSQISQISKTETV
jgi:hypothetical protein